MHKTLFSPEEKLEAILQKNKQNYRVICIN